MVHLLPDFNTEDDFVRTSLSSVGLLSKPARHLYIRKTNEEIIIAFRETISCSSKSSLKQKIAVGRAYREIMFMDTSNWRNRIAPAILSADITPDTFFTENMIFLPSLKPLPNAAPSSTDPSSFLSTICLFSLSIIRLWFRTNDELQHQKSHFNTGRLLYQSISITHQCPRILPQTSSPLPAKEERVRGKATVAHTKKL